MGKDMNVMKVSNSMLNLNKLLTIAEMITMTKKRSRTNLDKTLHKVSTSLRKRKTASSHLNKMQGRCRNVISDQYIKARSLRVTQVRLPGPQYGPKFQCRSHYREDKLVTKPSNAAVVI